MLTGIISRQMVEVRDVLGNVHYLAQGNECNSRVIADELEGFVYKRFAWDWNGRPMFFRYPMR